MLSLAPSLSLCPVLSLSSIILDLHTTHPYKYPSLPPSNTHNPPPSLETVEKKERERKVGVFVHGGLERERKWVSIVTTCSSRLPRFTENAPFTFRARATETKVQKKSNAITQKNDTPLKASRSKKGSLSSRGPTIIRKCSDVI
ncbi:hypothetical protein RHMOL_Rhmol01G0220500 [Rhododendron molle]|uniref:Uncharacterized protein n=1 Tax=Rhododendron molle TaxID=49168 RepID=A0ACC0Q5I3_RHOML|nr:hypothetical protein RHMOL_Rhmol01G0220500 [Rhododendron molle]